MAGIDDNQLIESMTDTNISEPWPQLAIAAGRRFRGPMVFTAIAVGVPVMGAAALFSFMAPSYRAAMSLQALVLFYAALTYMAHSRLTRSVFIIRKEGDRAVIDHQRWWRDDERRIPDSFKTWWPAQKRAVAWLYEVDTGKGSIKLASFNPWAESIERKPEWATAADIGGLKTTMQAAGKVSSHRISDGKETIKMGFLVLIISISLFATYYAGNKAVELFTGPAG